MNDIAEIGHNNPPLSEVLPLNYSELLKEAEDLKAQFGRAPETIDDTDNANRATTFVKNVNTFVKSVDKARVEEKEPYLKAGREVDAFFKAIAASVDPVLKDMKKRLTDYQVKVAAEERARQKAEEERLAEEARKAQEEADRIAANAQSGADIDTAIAREAEAAEKIAAATKAEQAAEKSASTTAIKTGGATSTLRKEWALKSLDKQSVDLEALRPFMKVEDLEKAARAYIKAGNHTLKGAVIEEEFKAVVR